MLEKLTCWQCPSDLSKRKVDASQVASCLRPAGWQGALNAIAVLPACQTKV